MGMPGDLVEQGAQISAKFGISKEPISTDLSKPISVNQFIASNPCQHRYQPPPRFRLTRPDCA